MRSKLILLSFVTFLGIYSGTYFLASVERILANSV
jgi:hypothetical protein